MGRSDEFVEPSMGLLIALEGIRLSGLTNMLDRRKIVEILRLTEDHDLVDELEALSGFQFMMHVLPALGELEREK